MTLATKSGGACDLPGFYRLVALDSVDSTNDEARRRLAGGTAAEGTLIWAGEQTAGRGRHGRSWSSPRGNLYLSLVLQPGCSPGEAAQLGFCAAVALAEALTAILPGEGRVRLKWPNDVLVDGAKVSGILLEAVSPGGAGGLGGLVLGVGVNVASRPQRPLYPTISLQEAGAGIAPAALLERFAACFLAWYETWRREGFAPVRAAWLGRAVGLGQRIEVRLDRETLVGRFAALDEGGALALDLPDAGRRLVAAGDVFFPHLHDGA